MPVALLALMAVPLLAGTFRVVQLLGGPVLIPADQRFEGFPLPLLVHIVGAVVFAVLGVMQLVPGFRRNHLRWHRNTGRVLAVSGLLVAGSGVWMTLIYETKPGTGLLLYVARLVAGSAMAACIVLGVTTVRRGDVAAHRRWMIRAYALAVAAGTQAITGGIAVALAGRNVVVGDIAMTSGWLINLAVAEWVIRRPGRRSRTRPVAAEAQPIHVEVGT